MAGVRPRAIGPGPGKTRSRRNTKPADQPVRLGGVCEMGIANWLVCGGIWALCAFFAVMFVRGAGIANARAEELEDEGSEFDTREMGLRARPRVQLVTPASRSSMARSAH